MLPSVNIVKPILNQLAAITSNKFNSPQRESQPKEEKIVTNRLPQMNVTEIRQSQSQPQAQPENKQKHTKEDVDAGNTLLIFLKELRKNHNRALTMSINSNDATKEKIEQHNTSPLSSMNASGGNFSVSTYGLVSETSQIHQPIPTHIRNDFNDASSTLSGDTRSFSANKDESIKSESSTESGSADASSEDDQKLNIKSGLMGPIRKRFRRTEFSSENVERHNNRTGNN